MPEPSGPEQETSYLNCAIPQTHWRRLEALTPVGALNERFLGYAMRPLTAANQRAARGVPPAGGTTSAVMKAEEKGPISLGKEAAERG